MMHTKIESGGNAFALASTVYVAETKFIGAKRNILNLVLEDT